MIEEIAVQKDVSQCTEEDMDRSGFIAAAARERLGDEPETGPFLNRLVDELGRVGDHMKHAFRPRSNLSRLIDEVDQPALDGLRSLTGHLSPSKKSSD